MNVSLLSLASSLSFRSAAVYSRISSRVRLPLPRIEAMVVIVVDVVLLFPALLLRWDGCRSR